MYLTSFDIAETLQGETIQKYQQLAIDTNITLSLGGFQEHNASANNNQSNNNHKVSNTTVVIGPTGEILETYQKVHMFDYAAGGLVESSFTVPGTEAKVVDINIGSNGGTGVKIGLSTCYDVRFPEYYQKLRRMDCKIVCIPSAFTHTTGLAHWHVLCRARAIETQSYVLCAAQSGYHNAQRRSFGHALVVNPWGVVVAEGGGSSRGENKGEKTMSTPMSTMSVEGMCDSELLVVDCDLNLVEEVRRKMPLELHRRPDVYCD